MKLHVGGNLLVLAKEPVPGRVKTRLCPPCTPAQAAVVAAAALADTLDAVHATPAVARTLVLSGDYRPPAGWSIRQQRGDGLAERLACAFADTAIDGTGSLLLGMDTPQITPAVLASVAGGLHDADAVLGPSDDGGWWVLALRDPYQARLLLDIPMSTMDTGVLTLAALRRNGLTVALAPPMRDVDTADDAHAVAASCPAGRFAAAVASHVPAGANL